MEKGETNSLKSILKPTEKGVWKGRKTSLADEYWYQVVQTTYTEIEASGIAIIGYACDEGVRRNQGRVGAVNGPITIRKSLAKFPVHFPLKQITDYGDVVCIGTDLEGTQEKLAFVVEYVVRKGKLSIVLGGGHDIAYGHFKGLYMALNTQEDKVLGIINFDAHFDLRSKEPQASSGTPFNQILQEFKQGTVSYLPIGIQEQGNTKSLYQIADKLGVSYIAFEACTQANFSAVEEKLHIFLEGIDYLYITIDMDGFSSAIAPGVSAANPIGLDYVFVEAALKILINSKKLIGLDVAEMNPDFDNDNQTAKLAARLVDFCLRLI